MECDSGEATGGASSASPHSPDDRIVQKSVVYQVIGDELSLDGVEVVIADEEIYVESSPMSPRSLSGENSNARLKIFDDQLANNSYDDENESVHAPIGKRTGECTVQVEEGVCIEISEENLENSDDSKSSEENSEIGESSKDGSEETSDTSKDSNGSDHVSHGNEGVTNENEKVTNENEILKKNDDGLKKKKKKNESVSKKSEDVLSKNEDALEHNDNSNENKNDLKDSKVDWKNIENKPNILNQTEGSILCKNISNDELKNDLQLDVKAAQDKSCKDENEGATNDNKASTNDVKASINVDKALTNVDKISTSDCKVPTDENDSTNNVKASAKDNAPNKDVQNVTNECEASTNEFKASTNEKALITRDNPSNRTLEDTTLKDDETRKTIKLSDDVKSRESPSTLETIQNEQEVDISNEQTNATVKRSRELKLLLELSKEANLNVNISHKRKSLDTARRAGTPDSTDKAKGNDTPKRVMRSQNPDFLAKHQKVGKSGEGDGQSSDAETPIKEGGEARGENKGEGRRKRDSFMESIDEFDRKKPLKAITKMIKVNQKR